MSRIPEDSEASIVLVGKVSFLRKPVMAFVRLLEARELGDVLSVPLPVRFIFILLGPEDGTSDFHEIGRSISTLMSNVDFHNSAYQADTKRDLLRSIKTFLDSSIVLPPGQLEDPNLLKSLTSFQKDVAKKKRSDEILQKMEESKHEINPLDRTGKYFGAVWGDIKRRYPKYLSDLKDGLNLQCLGAIVFIFFAILSPAITFGGLLANKTNNAMGVSETLIGSAAGGMISYVFLGQPLLILGMTGPNVVFEEALYNFCESNQVDFLSTRVWTGFWIAFIAIIFAMFEGSALILKFSRFTEEIFSILISLIFIIETFKKLGKTFEAHPLHSFEDQVYTCITNAMPNSNADNDVTSTNNIKFSNLDEAFNETNYEELHTHLDEKDFSECINMPNTALMSTLLCLGTFVLAMALRKFRGSNFLRSSVRRLIGDFGVPISIVVFVLVAYAADDVYTDKLNVPDAIAEGALRIRYKH